MWIQNSQLNIIQLTGYLSCEAFSVFIIVTVTAYDPQLFIGLLLSLSLSVMQFSL